MLEMKMNGSKNERSETTGTVGHGCAVGTPLYFDAVLEPHRALSRSGFVTVILIVGAISLAVGIFFLIKGAWPVFGFLGLDIFLLWLAIKLNTRTLKIVERIQVKVDEVRVTRETTRNARSWSFNPYWLNVTLQETAQGKGEIRLSSHGFSLGLGAFLMPRERREVADALKQVLADLGRIS
ncbi:MAG: hypothetical protein CMM54_07775 [Rhodospirillaceae bacterium]|nr:hypothetical protein [Rhodospirillaceae bacterium]|tara:strand:+ start:38 stop:580 length:543 start_codon:yes stop_codon:yes gene_type:complete